MTIVWLASLAGALFTAVIATVKNRNPLGWFFAGALLPLIAAILVAALPAVPPLWSGEQPRS